MRWFGFIFALALVAHAWATEDYLHVLLKHYKVADGAPVATKSCALCHVSDEDFAMNPYGKDLVAKLGESGGEVTDAVLASIDSLDSDGDGTPNGKEFAAGTFPGDPASGGVPGHNAPAPEPKKEEGLIPKTAFHPAVVHFPIGLFMAGLLLDLLGLIRKDKTLLTAGWYNLILAALSAIAGVATGFGAMVMMGFPMRGHMLEHLIYAVGASVMMWVMVGLRVHTHEQIRPVPRAIYYVLATACLIALSWAGHVGGVIAGTA